MGTAIGVIFALIVGYVCWTLTFALSGGAYPIGSAKATEIVVFFAPILGVVLPSIARNLAADQGLAALWLAALAPLAGAFNFLLYFLVMSFGRSIWGNNDLVGTLATAFACLIWVVPLAYSFLVPVKSPRRDYPSDHECSMHCWSARSRHLALRSRGRCPASRSAPLMSNVEVRIHWFSMTAVWQPV